ncbi:D-3-phosphoglycerate dehydrogenase [Clostridia bacterium]|nr:D-3-phosphoglycerate dehydrogenase [Clostridia bacterium]
MSFKILTLNKISKTGLAPLTEDKFEISDEMANPDGIILRSFAMHEYELPKSLLAVARAGAGVNNIPIPKCAEAGIVVFNTPGANANAVKEMVIAALMLSNRKIVDGINWAQALSRKGDVAKLVEKGKGEFVGPEITGKKLGIIGLGAIGVLVANAAVHLGMEVIGYDPFLSVESAWTISRSVKRAKDINEIYEQSDYITLHSPYNDKTKNMINADVLAKVKKGVRILNFARGELVENAAVKAAVADGTVSTYITDFPVEELLGIPGIITVPHLAASTPEAEENCAVMAANELKDYLEAGVIKNSVNFPDAYLPFAGGVRFCVIHKNMPKILGPITTVFADKGININEMVSSSKGDFAYAILDTPSGDYDLDAIDKELLAVTGVIKTRVIGE